MLRRATEAGSHLRIMGKKHNLRSEGHTWDLQEATADPRMEDVAGTEFKFSLTWESGM